MISNPGLDPNAEDTFQALRELTTAPDTTDHSNTSTIILPLGFHATPSPSFPFLFPVVPFFVLVDSLQLPPEGQHAPNSGPGPLSTLCILLK